MVAFLIFANLLVWYEIYQKEHQELTVAFLDVGQGDAILIETPHGSQMLIDGGPNKKVLSELGGVMPFYDRSIDVVLATHPDADHIGGLPYVFRRFRVDAYINNGSTHDTATFRTLESEAEKENANIIEAHKGQRIWLDTNIYADVLSPEINASVSDNNDASIVLKLVYGDTEVMLTGDASEKIENYLVRNYGSSLQSDILKAGHHGSKTATSKDFLESVKPSLVVISAGENNRYGHPHQEVIDLLTKLGIEIKNTATDGRVVFKSDGESILVN